MPEASEPTVKKQKPAHLFKPGQSGNPAGRPKGARGKLGEDFVKALQKDFAEHGVEAVQKVRETKPEVYLSVIAKIVPKELNVNVNVLQEFTAWMAERGRDKPRSTALN